MGVQASRLCFFCVQRADVQSCFTAQAHRMLQQCERVQRCKGKSRASVFCDLLAVRWKCDRPTTINRRGILWRMLCDDKWKATWGCARCWRWLMRDSPCGKPATSEGRQLTRDEEWSVGKILLCALCLALVGWSCWMIFLSPFLSLSSGPTINVHSCMLRSVPNKDSNQSTL